MDENGAAGDNVVINDVKKAPGSASVMTSKLGGGDRAVSPSSSST